MTVRGVLSGVMGLIILQVLVSRGGSANVSGLFGAIATGAKRALEPGVPAIPNLTGSSGASSAPSTPPAPGQPAPAPGPTPMPRPTFGPANSPVLLV